MDLKSHGISKKDLGFSVLLLAAFSALFYMFPYTGDDWAWGSQLGLDRLATRFDNYNGRYLGNLLVLVLTRCKWVNVLLTAFSMVCFCLFPKLLAKSEKFLPYALGTLFFFLIPQSMWAQVVVWTSGFSNYVPPILMIFLYLILVQNVFDEVPPEYVRAAIAIVPFLGFAAGLFMENVTLYNLAVAVVIPVIGFVRFRKVYGLHLAYAGGSIAGAVMMFTNSAYSTIVQGGDEYRSSALNSGLIGTIANNLNVIIRSFFLENMAVWGILSVLCLACWMMYRKSGEEKKICHFAVGVHILCGVLLAIKSFCPAWLILGNETITVLFFAAIAVTYCFGALIVVLLCVDEQKMKLWILFLLVSIPVLIAPLLVVNPVGARCLFASYMMLAAACVMLLVYVMEHLHFSAAVQKSLGAAILAVCAVVMICMVNVYLAVHRYDTLRDEYVRKQVKAGYQTVMVSKLPHESYVWCSVPENLWAERYKLFHGIDLDVEFELLTPAEFDSWMKNFDESHG